MDEAKLDKLNSFLRGEISAVETYMVALGKVASGSPTRATLGPTRVGIPGRRRVT